VNSQHRVSIGLAGVGVLLVSALVGRSIFRFSSLADADPDPTTRSTLRQPPGEGSTYLLTDVEVRYPFVDPFTRAGDNASAGIKYTPVWAETQYPGPVACQITLSDSRGSLVGERQFTLDSASSAPKPSSFVAVPVTAPPASARGKCEVGEPQVGTGYWFEDPAIVAGSNNDSLIRFTAHWRGVNPGTRLCTLVVVKKNGEKKKYGQVGLSVPDGGEVGLVADVLPNSIADASMECEVITQSAASQSPARAKGMEARLVHP
jgi:hypothetical protein